MKLCLVLRHVHFEDLGVFAEPIRHGGYAIRYVDTPVEALDAEAALNADLLVVLGGPIGAGDAGRYPWLAVELADVSRRLAAKRPTLGICLGSQLMATALGAAVVTASEVEIGWSELVLSSNGRASSFAALSDVPVFHWHGDRFELPEGATSLASTALCPHQAFAVGRHALALQFHAEVDPALFEHWLVGNAAELVVLGVHPEALRAATRRYGAAAAIAAQAMIGTWLEGLN